MEQESNTINNDNQIKALNVLINGVKMAQKRGAYELPEAEILWNAIKVFLVSEPNSDTPNIETDVSFKNDLGN